MMDIHKPASRRYFTDATRAAALEARRRKKEAAMPRDTPEVFVIRLPGATLLYGWEIRRFGAVVLDKSSMKYSTLTEAYAAGHGVLAGRGDPA